MYTVGWRSYRLGSKKKTLVKELYKFSSHEQLSVDFVEGFETAVEK